VTSCAIQVLSGGAVAHFATGLCTDIPALTVMCTETSEGLRKARQTTL
jgi:hypothetical protein